VLGSDLAAVQLDDPFTVVDVVRRLNFHDHVSIRGLQRSPISDAVPNAVTRLTHEHATLQTYTIIQPRFETEGMI
jgi:hypothetical protein